ncbi:MAG: bifunctional diaminohydroxyphosphoribosylaminopyrimidine deaminase/5-amino-6-(5-phosphoribosylamino)uracil reductase RibD, partial [bacterium]|nr:bifunctional diaminohydroxyphosphoribosylaminopyrimidine deaminase/5-amino-6-(5-phosphoribosylamino)uracil reductase RibD [bacterium]
MSLAEDREYMLKAIGLAEQGRGLTKPNPLVGAVIVKGKRLLAADYHHKAGQPHAEILAINKASGVRGATLYVNLEPCCHTGRTGPCTEAIIKAGIKRVVFAMTDPDPRVSGKGARTLRKNGLQVKSGVAKQEAER